jgi:hypothetical protein
VFSHYLGQWVLSKGVEFSFQSSKSELFHPTTPVYQVYIGVKISTFQQNAVQRKAWIFAWKPFDEWVVRRGHREISVMDKT